MKRLAAIAGMALALIAISCAGRVKDEPINTPPDPTWTLSTPFTSATAKAPGAAPVTKAPPHIEADTLVHVGEDVPAGTYRAIWDANAGEALGLTGNCYWSKSRDAEGQDIIANDIVKGGRPQVTLAKGQWFVSQDCGEWAKK